MRWRWSWLRWATLTTILFLYLPIVVLILYSFNASRLSTSWQGFTFAWYGMLVHDRSLINAALNSGFIAAVSTVLALCLGVSGVLGLEGLRARRQDAIESAIMLPLVIPEVMMGVALMLFFVTIKMPLSLATVVIGHVVFNVPLVMIIVRARLRKLDRRLTEAARDLGASRWQVFHRVTEPLLRPAIVGAGLIAFTVSLDDFIVTFFVAGPGATTLPLKVYSMIKAGITPEINALSTIVVLASMSLVGLSVLLQRKFA
ncbi:MAG: ABC transporter permease [Nitrospiraceae bacterium]